MAMRVILVGHGYFGSLYRERIQKNPKYKLVAVCDQNPERLEGLVGCDTSASYAEVARRLDHDAVIIATTPDMHESLIREGLMENKHVLCQKPGFFSEQSAKELMFLAEFRRLALMIDYTMMWTRDIEYLEDTMGTLGYAQRVTTFRSVVGAPRKESIVWDLLPHDAAIVDNFMLKYRDKKNVTIHAVVETFGATVAMRRDGDLIATMTAKYNTVPPRKEAVFHIKPDFNRITNPRFILKWDQQQRFVETDTQGRTTSVHFQTQPDPICESLARFERTVQGGLGHFGNRAIEVTKLLERIDESGRTGRVVEL